MSPRPMPVADRLRRHIIEAPSGCWIWVGARNKFGYGKVHYEGRVLGAHRVSYLTFVGPIPEGMQTDHLCRRRACVRPLHLQIVTPQTNTRRGTSPGARALRSSICVRGHRYSETAVFYDGKRRCRECMRENNRRRGERAAA